MICYIFSSSLYSICILTRRGIYKKILPEAQGNPKGKAWGIFQGLRLYFIEFFDLNHRHSQLQLKHWPSWEINLICTIQSFPIKKFEIGDDSKLHSYIDFCCPSLLKKESTKNTWIIDFLQLWGFCYFERKKSLPPYFFCENKIFSKS